MIFDRGASEKKLCKGVHGTFEQGTGVLQHSGPAAISFM